MLSLDWCLCLRTVVAADTELLVVLQAELLLEPLLELLLDDRVYEVVTCL